ncbi:MAG: HD domain-containing protein [Chloroflexia bacterium]|nr:HD domain-containing protein [Chloroflexia bacterium]
MEAPKSQQPFGQRERLLLFLGQRPDRIVRDPIYEAIPLTRQVLAILETPEFLRLGRIRQLTFVHLVWPGATHTRYGHSLGVYHLTKQALLSLLHSDETGVMDALTPQDLQTALAAALLHDIGHYPFSHAIEELGHPPIRSHEAVGETIIRDSSITPVLSEVWDVDPLRVSRLIRGHGVEGIDRLLHGLLSGALDTDKLDYLVRDSERCNVHYGLVDVARLLDSLKVRADLPGGPVLAITHKGVGALHSLIHAKRSMFDIVYGHHVNAIASTMLLRCVQDLLEAGLLEAGELTMQDDAGLVHLVRERAAQDCAGSLELIEDLLQRRLYKRGLIVTKQMTPKLFRELDSLHAQPRQRKRVEQALAQEFGPLLGRPVRDHEILLSIPKPTNYEVDIQVYYEEKSRPLGYEEYMDWERATGLRADDLERYQNYARRFLVIAPADICALLKTPRGQEAALRLLRQAKRL